MWRRLLLLASLTPWVTGERLVDTPDSVLPPLPLVATVRNLHAGGIHGVLADPVATLPAVVEKDDVGSDHLSRALDVRGGSSTELVTATSAFDLKSIMPLLSKVKTPLRIGLLTWVIHDKIWRTTQIFLKASYLNDRDAQLMSVAGLDLHAAEAMKSLIATSAASSDLAHDEQAKKSFAAMTKQLSSNIKLGAEVLADFALSVSEKTYKRIIKQNATLRVADAVTFNKKKRVKTQGKFLDLRGRALSEAATLDVTKELVPSTFKAEKRITLLGLVAALCHESVFEKVQLAMRPAGATGRVLTIAEFKQMQGIEGVADLFKRLVSKYATSKKQFHLWMALYTVSTVTQVDPDYFQIGWGLFIGQILAKNYLAPSERRLKVYGGLEAAFRIAEVRWRFTQLVNVCNKALNRYGLSTINYLQATNGVLTTLLFLDLVINKDLAGNLVNGFKAFEKETVIAADLASCVS